MAETYRTLPDGRKLTNDGVIGDQADGSPAPLFYVEKPITHAQISTGNSSPVEIFSAETGKRYAPVAWHFEHDHGGVDYTGNTNVEILCGSVPAGEAGLALDGGTDRVTVGTIVSAVCDSGAPIRIRVKTGNPTGGSAASKFTARVLFMKL